MLVVLMKIIIRNARVLIKVKTYNYDAPGSNLYDFMAICCFES